MFGCSVKRSPLCILRGERITLTQNREIFVCQTFDLGEVSRVSGFQGERRPKREDEHFEPNLDANQMNKIKLT